MGVLTLVLIIVAITVIGGGGAYLVYLKLQPKKMAWTAYCYQLGDGVRSGLVDSDGKVISDLKLQDLRPYRKDVLVKLDKPNARSVYKLERLNLTTGAVSGEVVDFWDVDAQFVSVLVVGNCATLLKKGYDKVSGSIIFQPMSRERIDLIKSEILIKRDRLKREKSILEAITPWIVAGICILGLVSITYFLSSSYLKSSTALADSEKYGSDKYFKASENFREALSGITRQVNELKDLKAVSKVDSGVPLLESSVPLSGNLSLGLQK